MSRKLTTRAMAAAAGLAMVVIVIVLYSAVTRPPANTSTSLPAASVGSVSPTPAGGSGEMLPPGTRPPVATAEPTPNPSLVPVATETPVSSSLALVRVQVVAFFYPGAQPAAGPTVGPLQMAVPHAPLVVVPADAEQPVIATATADQSGVGEVRLPDGEFLIYVPDSPEAQRIFPIGGEQPAGSLRNRQPIYGAARVTVRGGGVITATLEIGIAGS